MKSDCPRLLFAAPSSGVGKTTLTIGFLQALLGRGMKPAAFKCGPDYIDPMFHSEILGVRGYNLDLFFTSPAVVRGLLRRGCADADVAVLEGAMGLYDGVAGTDEASSWHVAAETGTPAVLIVRPGGSFLSLAALVDGFVRFREKSMVRGIVLNRCGERLFGKLRPMLERETGLRVYGFLPDVPEVSLESRHLGLATPDSVVDLRGKVAALSERVEATVDVAGLLDLARTASPLTDVLPETRPASTRRPRVAVARDAAFCFYYRENLELLEALGAELVYFSPIADPALPNGIGGLYIGGGYPELHLDALSGNRSMRESVRDAVASGLPTLAECGGFLYLRQELCGPDGAARPMVGALPGSGRRAGGLDRFGYVSLRAKRDNVLCAAGESIRAHEFHYWDSARRGDAFVARKPGGGEAWDCVHATDTLFAGFPHLYFLSNPAFARNFVEAAARRSDG